jgi:hypothetical protein
MKFLMVDLLQLLVLKGISKNSLGSATIRNFSITAVYLWARLSGIDILPFGRRSFWGILAEISIG